LQALNDPLIEPVITPRFVPTCTLDLMTQLGALARREGVLVQSHLSETKSEIAWVKELHPTVDPLHMPPPPHTHTNEHTTCVGACITQGKARSQFCSNATSLVVASHLQPFTFLHMHRLSPHILSWSLCCLPSTRATQTCTTVVDFSIPAER
jgi:hypothetical protein